MLFCFIAIVPSLFAYYHLILNKEDTSDKVIGWSIIGLSTAIAGGLAIWLFYPFFRNYFDEESVEWPVLKPEDALKIYFAI